MQKDAGNSKKLNFLLFLFTLIAGAVWWGVGEVFFTFTKTGTANIIRNPLLNGAYFSFLTLFTILACLLSEKIVHSIVNGYFFQEVVMTPSLKKILPAAFIAMFLVAGLMEFIYELEPARSVPVQVSKPPKPTVTPTPTPTPPKQEVIPVDYYFLLDNTISLMDNDPNEERIKLLEKIVNTFSEDRKIALISFGNKAIIHMYPEYATNQIKRQFITTIKRLIMQDGTNIKNALINASSILVNDYSRKEVIIFITDGEDIYGFNEQSDEFKRVLWPFISAEVPIHSIFLNPYNTDSSFLKRVSSLTKGIYSTVKNPVDLESYITKVIESEEEQEDVTIDPSITTPVPTVRQRGGLAKEPLRDLLDVRTGKRQNSLLYALMRIIFGMFIGLLMGYSIFMIFSSGRIFFALLLGGGISGVLAGLVLEIGFQTYYLPDYIIRLLACIVLSTVFWLLSLASGWVIGLITGTPVFALWDYDEDKTDNILTSGQDEGGGNGSLEGKEKGKTESGQGKFGI